MSGEPSGSPKVRPASLGTDPAPESARQDEAREGLVYIPDVVFRGLVGSGWDRPPTARDSARCRQKATAVRNSTTRTANPPRRANPA
jgi:hypothetical protein